MNAVFSDGDLVLMVDAKGRRYLVHLHSGEKFHSHAGSFSYDEVVGSSEGVTVRSSGGQVFRIVRPTLGDYVLKMKRGAQVIYPKDIGPILVWGDIFPGARVLEAGLGSGALTMALLRAVGEQGSVVSYEMREEHASQALANIKMFLGDCPNHQVRIADIYDGIEETDLDRVMLDLAEPWWAVPHVASSLRLGGVLLTYLPTVPQLEKCSDAMRAGGFAFVETFEVMHRGWNIDGRSVRPDHRMVAHTGFLTVGRRVD